MHIYVERAPDAVESHLYVKDSEATATEKAWLATLNRVLESGFDYVRMTAEQPHYGATEWLRPTQASNKTASFANEMRSVPAQMQADKAVAAGKKIRTCPWRCLSQDRKGSRVS